MLSDAETHFYDLKILNISILRKWALNGFKTLKNEKIS